MFKFSALGTIGTLIPLLSFVVAQIPYFPDITNPNFPMGSRCIDYCAFLRPGEICPGRALDVRCLCEVYNVRLSPVRFTIHKLVLMRSVNNVGLTKTQPLPMSCSPS